jgi:hypothetical protein
MRVPDKQDFFTWFGEKTERAWGGTRWKALTASEINAAEAKWNIEFPPDYRAFLEALGATDRPMQGANYSGPPPDNGLQPYESPGFYDWRADHTAIQEALDWPLEGLHFDVENNDLWMDSWGSRPDLKSERETVLSELARAAPPLIPVYGHRYLLGHPIQAGNPVLSVYQADIIVYGDDLRQYLMNEMAERINLDPGWTQEQASDRVTEEVIRSIPFWGELMML